MLDSDIQAGAFEATGACTRFQHMADRATTNGLSFLRKVYPGVRLPYYNPTRSANCTQKFERLKDFLSEPLISTLGGQHYFPSLSKEDSLSLCASISSIIKSFPLSCECMEDGMYGKLKATLTQPPRDLPEDYLSFARSVVRDLFPHGITQKRIDRSKRSIVPPLTSTTLDSRKSGGSYAYWQGKRDEFLSSDEVVHRPEFMIANSPGKPRPLVKNHPSYLLLKPLHKVIYDRLSALPWLLRGAPTPSRLARAGFVGRGTYLSADFSSATDNIPTEVAEAIIEELAFLSPCSLSPIFSEALRSLRPLVTKENDSFTVSRGQLMGNLLSFPLLCLQNYISSRYVDKIVGEQPARLINGDDLAVQCSKKWRDTYVELIPSLGLELNKKKTSYTSEFVTINSTYFTSNLKLIPFVRCGSLSVIDPRDIAEAIDSLARDFYHKRRKVVKCALLFFERLIRKSGQTLYKLGVRFGKRMQCIPRALWRREKKRDGGVSLAKDAGGFHQKMVPLGDIAAARASVLVEDKEIAEVVVSATWDLGDYVPQERTKLKDVWLLCEQNRSFRTKECAYERRSRLRRVRSEKKVMVPESLEDCLTLSHSTVFLQDGFFHNVECSLCERVRELAQRENRERLEEERKRQVRDWYFAKRRSCIRSADIIWD
nr:RNA-dependent RNA polymerase [Monilinia fructicola botourmiavirus 6]